MSKIIENLLNNEQNLGSPSQTSQINSPPLNNSSEEPSLMSIVSSVLTPLIPVFMAKLTGQKLPMNTATNDQQSLQQLTPVLQTMIHTQNLLLQEIVILKQNAQNIANSFQNLRLTHKQESKQIEFNNQNQ